MTDNSYHAWLDWDPSMPNTLHIDKPDYQGLLDQIQDDDVLCKVIVAVHNGATFVARRCSLSADQLRNVCALAFLQLLQSLQSGETCYLGEAFLSALGLTAESATGPAVTTRALQVISDITLAATKARYTARKTIDEWTFQAAIHDERTPSGPVRYVLIRSDATARNKQRAEFSAVYGFNEEQLEYVIDHGGEVGVLLISGERPDISRQILHACACHAAGKLPPLRVAGWGWGKITSG